MAVMNIIKFPNPILSRKSAEIGSQDVFSSALEKMLSDTLSSTTGIGISAIQIGVPLRMMVLSVPMPDGSEFSETMLNPKILSSSDEQKAVGEGCLSLPDMRVCVRRPVSVTVTYSDMNGLSHELTASDLLARCIQHEMDHMDGISIIDKCTAEERFSILNKQIAERLINCKRSRFGK